MAKKGEKKRQPSVKRRSEQHSDGAMVVARWASPYSYSYSSSSSDIRVMDDAPPPPLAEWLPPSSFNINKPLIIDLHTHSACSDGMLTPQQLVQRAVSSGGASPRCCASFDCCFVPAALSDSGWGGCCSGSSTLVCSCCNGSPAPLSSDSCCSPSASGSCLSLVSTGWSTATSASVVTPASLGGCSSETTIVSALVDEFFYWTTSNHCVDAKNSA